MTHHIENEVYKKLHANQELHIEDLRRARDYQAELFEMKRRMRVIAVLAIVCLLATAVNAYLYVGHHFK